MPPDLVLHHRVARELPQVVERAAYRLWRHEVEPCAECSHGSAGVLDPF